MRIKCVTKSYLDGRSLSMLLIGYVIIEKHMTYKVPWEIGEKKKGAGERRGCC